jgi:hypothetical protein
MPAKSNDFTTSPIFTVFSHFIHILSHFPVKKATGKTLAKSITYEHLIEHKFCLFETGVWKVNLVASRAAFYLIVII